MRAHLPAITQLEAAGRAKLVAAADPDPQRRAILVEQRPQVRTFASTEEMLAAGAADVLVVAAAPETHAELVVRGFAHEMHVLCEKPLTGTRSGHALVAEACATRPDLALVPVHQYRYSPQWATVARWAGWASRLKLPFSLLAEVQRNRTDPTATSDWRANIAANGGMLADAGVHFLALAWTISQQLDVLEAARHHDHVGQERAAAALRLGPGRLNLRVWRGAPQRRTRIELRQCGTRIAWADHEALTWLGGLSLASRQVSALSDRRHVDALCQPLYREMAFGLPDPRWRRRRTAEALGVDAALVSLLERTPILVETGS
jgi:predicted dehydrogenase